MAIAPISETRLLADRYEVIAALGSGSAANVFRVLDRRTGAMRAAKVLKPENAADPKVLARFEDEFRILRTLHHPHLPEVYDYGWTDDGGRFLIMELVDGVPLDEFFRSNPGDIWTILYELCETLTFVHNHKLLHQDIKPSNILVRRTTAFGPNLPLVKLIDFGLTYRRDAGAAVELVGTPEYMAPEVVRGESSLTRAVDYYSLGVTLYELLCGKPPFVGSESEVLRAHLQREAVIEEEKLEWAELYPHVRALLTKNWRARLEAFEELRRAVISRLTGGIEELDRAYGLARIDSLPMIGKEEVWGEMMGWLGGLRSFSKYDPAIMVLVGEHGVGKAFLIDALRAECATQQVQVLFVEDLMGRRSPANERTERPANSETTALARVWARAKQATAHGPVVVVAAGRGGDATEVLKFLRFAETSWSLEEEPVRAHLRFVASLASTPDVVGAALTVSATYRQVSVDSLRTSTMERFIDSFRGELARSEDSRVLRSVIEKVQTVGHLIRTMQHAATTGGLAFKNQKWSISRTLSETPAGMVSSMTTALRSRLSAEQELIVTCLSCHDQTVPIDWIAKVTGLPQATVSTVLDELRILQLIGDRSDDRPSVFLSAMARHRAIETDGVSKRSQLHTAFIARLRSEMPPTNTDRWIVTMDSLVYHYTQLGALAGVLRVHHALIGGLRSVGAHVDIEKRCRVGIGVCSTLPNTDRSNFARRYYLRQLVNALWARNLTIQTYNAINEMVSSHDEQASPSLWPKYARGMMDSEGPTVTLAWLRQHQALSAPHMKALHIRLDLEIALCLYNVGQYKTALATLAFKPEEVAALSSCDRHRMSLYRVMVLHALGKTTKAARILGSIGPRILHDSCHDEYGLCQMLRAVMTLNRGKPNDALAVIVGSLRLMRRKQLLLREVQLLVTASSAYAARGEYDRARHCRENAIQVAYLLDQKKLVSSSWTRLSLYAKNGGRYGDALRYIRRAGETYPGSAITLERTLVQLVELELLIAMHSPLVIRRAKAIVPLLAHSQEHAYYELLLGEHQCAIGAHVEARRHYGRARMLFEKVQRIDDAVRAASAECRCYVHEGQGKEALGLLARTKGLAARVESVEVRAQWAEAELSCHYHLRSDRTHLDRLTRICQLLEERAEWLTRARIRSLRFHVAARRGDAKGACEVLALLSDMLRAAAANLSDSELTEGLLKSSGLLGLVAEAQLLDRDNAHAAQRLASAA